MNGNRQSELRTGIPSYSDTGPGPSEPSSGALGEAAPNPTFRGVPSTTSSQSTCQYDPELARNSRSGRPLLPTEIGVQVLWGENSCICRWPAGIQW